MTKNKEKVFIEITNRDLYKTLKCIERKVTNIEKHAIETNGKTKINNMRSKINLSLIILLIAGILGLAWKVVL